MSEPTPNNEAAIKFLKLWSPKGPWILTSISTDRKGVQTRSFDASAEGEAKAWLEKYNGQRNIYFTVNDTFGPMEKKPMKEHMKAAVCLHIDIDPAEGHNIEKEQERCLELLTDKLPKGIPKPTAIIFSGGGFQGFWKLKEPIKTDGDLPKAEDFELYNKRLEQLFDGDHCHNIDRIMRLPGTINVPNAKKVKAGRVKELAKLIDYDAECVYDIEDFKKAQPVQMAGGVDHQGGNYGVEVNISGNIQPIVDIDELDEWNVPDRVKVIVVQGHHPDQPKDKDNSRSSWLFDCVCNLVRCQVPDDVIYSLITDPDWGISESVREAKPNADRYARRQIKNAKEHAEDPQLRIMNEKHAVIGNIGGKCRIIEEVIDNVMGRNRITISSFEDLRNRYGNKKIQIGEREGQAVFSSLGKYWLAHPMRRQFDFMRFMPQGDVEGVYNLWRGFAVHPDPKGSCEMYLNHIKDNVCNGVQEHYEYFIKWMANTVQNPARQGEVAIVMRGGKGTGKSVTAKVFGKVFGRHFLHVANPSHLVGNFNAHLRDVIFLFADEAFFAGDKRHESVLKMLVTEDSIPIEAKGVDVEPVPNYVHLMMAANDPHVIRASGDERRYFVLEVEGKNKQDKEFFGNMMKQMDDGGYEALLYFLQGIDLTDFQVRDVPQTDALQEQKLLSMDVNEEWWFRKLQHGRLLDTDSEWSPQIHTEALHTDFTAYAEKWRFTRRGNETALGRFLARIAPHKKKFQTRMNFEEIDERGGPKTVSKRVYAYDFGSLEECRAAWEKTYGKCDWSIDDSHPLDPDPKDDGPSPKREAPF